MLSKQTGQVNIEFWSPTLKLSQNGLVSICSTAVQYYLFIYLNIFIHDIKHNSARLLYVALLYNKTMLVHKNTLSYAVCVLT